MTILSRDWKRADVVLPSPSTAAAGTCPCPSPEVDLARERVTGDRGRGGHLVVRLRGVSMGGPAGMGDRGVDEPSGAQPVDQFGRSWRRMRAMARRSSRDTCICEKPTRAAI